MEALRGKTAPSVIVRLILVAGAIVLLVAVSVSGCGVATAAAEPSSLQTASAVEASNTITVTGTGTVSNAPDEAVITLTVETDGKDPASAMNANSQVAAKVLARLKSEGVAGDAVATSNVSVYPVRTYNPDTGAETLTGYRADNSVTVTLSDIVAIGKVLAAAVDSGVTDITGPAWQLKDDTSATAAALKKAVANAEGKAAVLAGAAGVKVGPVLMINEGTETLPQPLVYNYGVAGGDASKATTVPVSPGTLDVTANVTVTYSLEQ